MSAAVRVSMSVMQNPMPIDACRRRHKEDAEREGDEERVDGAYPHNVMDMRPYNCQAKL